MRTLHDQIGGRCVHFTGLLKQTCNAGVVYKTLQAVGPLPCLSEALRPPRPGEPPRATCPRVRFPVGAELEELVAKDEAKTRELLRQRDEALANGQCPECAKELEPLRQDSCCVYAACGHRLGQGTVAHYRGQRRAPMPGPPPGHEGDEAYDFDPDPDFDFI